MAVHAEDTLAPSSLYLRLLNRALALILLAAVLVSPANRLMFASSAIVAAWSGVKVVGTVKLKWSGSDWMLKGVMPLLSK